ncbi:hypothetical protein D9619_000069 [Psilocybe cf. subviscida]|uniref:Endoplasmic reticulum junction formation protein lunapark n=1 Tax=Psilocybe cf. subviscida TaxID=2480587 RepID=A0A8H5BGK1_9AGAR|nr:hypothetical protein D9619_000069 [Psilocybe cf. subviscida]
MATSRGHHHRSSRSAGLRRQNLFLLYAFSFINPPLGSKACTSPSMSLIRRLFSRRSEEDYETVLSNLADEVQKRQIHLSEIRLRERRATLQITLYTLAGWVAYVSLWYLNVLPHFKHGVSFGGINVERMTKSVPVVIGPIIILFIRRIVQIWYMRKGNAEEKALKELLKKQRDKVEEIKKKTNYNHTRDLIQKYDEASPSATPLRPRFGPVPPGGLQQTPVQRRPVPVNGAPIMQTPGPGVSSAALQIHLTSAATPSKPLPPPRKGVIDRLADALLGEDELPAPPSSRYALICEKCFTHNGLVRESMWEDAQYTCPKCGHFNESAKTKKERNGRMSAASSPTAMRQTSSLGPTQRMSVSPHPHSRTSPQISSGSASPLNGTVSLLDGDRPTVDGAESTAMEIDSGSP